MSIGVSYEDFWHYTPHDMNLLYEGYKDRQQQQMEYDNLFAFIQGRYYVDALLCTIGNMFSKKGAKQFDYPKEPYNLGNKEEHELTEEEKEIQVKQIFANLERMKSNFERERARKGSSN